MGWFLYYLDFRHERINKFDIACLSETFVDSKFLTDDNNL